MEAKRKNKAMSEILIKRSMDQKPKADGRYHILSNTLVFDKKSGKQTVVPIPDNAMYHFEDGWEFGNIACWYEPIEAVSDEEIEDYVLAHNAYSDEIFAASEAAKWMRDKIFNQK